MRFLSLCLLICLRISSPAFGQIHSPQFKSSDNSRCEILQIGLTDSTTHVFCKYTSASLDDKHLFVNNESVIKDSKSGKLYQLRNSVNIPYGPAYHEFDEAGGILYFTLTYEPIPKNVTEIDINSEVFDFFGVSLIDNTNSTDSTDYLKLLESTPVKEKGFFYKEGNVVQYYIHKGLVIAMNVEETNTYGRYYTSYISIENFSSKRFDFLPENIKAIFGDSKTSENFITNREYNVNVLNKQSQEAYFVALGEYKDANSVGSSTSISLTNTNGQQFSLGAFGSGYIGSNVRTYSDFSLGTTINYNATANYYARKNAEKNVAGFKSQQYQIKEAINQGYLKRNTIFPDQRLNGFININYRISNKVNILVLVRDDTYSFTWSRNLSNKEQAISMSLQKKEQEKFFIDSVISANKFTEEKYKNVEDVNVGDLVKFQTFNGDYVVGLVTGKNGSFVLFTSYTRYGQAFNWEEKFKELIFIKQ